MFTISRQPYIEVDPSVLAVETLDILICASLGRVSWRCEKASANAALLDAVSFLLTERERRDRYK